MKWHVMPAYGDYETARAEFSWSFPERYNPAVDCLRDHEDPGPAERVALIDAATGDRYTYADLDTQASRLAAGLRERGVEAGDRVGVVAPQRPATIVAHVANWLLGAVTIPLTTLFGRDALSYRLDDAEAVAVVFDPTVRDDLAAASGECPGLETAVELEATPWYHGDREPPAAAEADFDCDVVARQDLVDGQPDRIDAHESTVETESALLYTSGSTGPPKGVLHGHALWLGRAAAAYNFFDGRLSPDGVSWTPADWAWGSALGGLLMGTLHYGGTAVAAPMQGFDPVRAFELLDEYDVTRALVPPTALRMLMAEDAADYDLSLQAIASAGEPVTPEILAWADDALDDCAVNEYYGQTELNLVVGNASRWFETRPGSMGKAYPGYDVAVLDPETRAELPHDEVGELAVRPDDERVFFEAYWNRPEATAAKRHGDWFLTDDLVTQDAEGYLHFESRADDVIITSGYRVGPREVEQVLLDHPAVEQVGVVGVPDETRGEIIKAFVELAPGADGDDDLRETLRARARDRLAEYEYPREIEFAGSLPKTASGKIRRVELRPDRDGD
ncbi:MAG: acyl-CoA synthetase [Halolamina sp.]